MASSVANTKEKVPKRDEKTLTSKNDKEKSSHHHHSHDKKKHHNKHHEMQKTSKAESDTEVHTIDESERSSFDEMIRKEALELGASEEDLKLVQGIEDDNDDNGSVQEFGDDSSDSKLTADVQAYLKKLELGEVQDDIDDVDVKTNTVGGKKAKEKKAKDVPSANISKENVQVAENVDLESKAKPEVFKQKQGKKIVFEDSVGAKQKSKEQHRLTEAELKSVSSSNFVVEPRNDWYNIPLELNSETPDRSLKQYEIDELYDHAKTIVNKENDLYYSEFNKSSSQQRFLSQVLSNGTLSDKISALTLLVQEAPMHNIKSLDNLLGMCSKKSRSAAIQCVDAVVDLFVNGIIPSNRKLKYFKNQPLTKDLTDMQLAIFYFEDYLKGWYFEFVSTLERLSHDSIEFVRTRIVSHIFNLLIAKPEQEANLLRLGVNKLGDMDNKVSSKTSYSIMTLEQKHPAMTSIVTDAIIDVMFRQKNDHHAIYYSVVTLNQTVLTRKQESLANKLVNAYFALFEKLLVQTDADNVGKLKESDHNTEGRHKRRAKKGKHGGKSVKQEIKTEQELAEERNSKAFSAILTGLNRAFPFSNLPEEVFDSHLEVLYKITHSSNFNTSIQALLLLQKVVEKSGNSTKVDRYYRTLYESLLDDRLLTSSKQAIYLNLLFKSLKSDSDKKRILAFAKRICQVCLCWLNVGAISGMLFLLLRLYKYVPELRNLLYNTPSDEALMAKVQDEEDEILVDQEPDREDTINSKKIVDSSKSKEHYDPRKRDPRFANAEKSSLWEIEYFIRHFHPTVDLYADALLDGKRVPKPDLGLYTLGHFLDRFVYKKPKKNLPTRGQSIMQPLGGPHTGDLLVKASTISELREIPANTEEWISRKIDSIRPEDRFFYEYFSAKQEREQSSKFDKEVAKEADEDFHDNGEELDDDTVWEALVSSKPDIEGDDLYDDEVADLDMSDFDDGSDDEEDDIKVDNEDVLEAADLEEDSENGSIEGIEEENNKSESGEDDDEQKAENGEHSEDDDEDDDDIKELLEAEKNSQAENSDDEEIILEKKDDEAALSGSKRKLTGKEGKKKRVKLSSLPLFASADEYARLIDEDDDSSDEGE